MLEVTAVECVRGERSLFADLTFRVGSGEMLHVCGANGAGKTSLLRLCAGLLRPAAGEISWRGASIACLRENYRREMTYLGHENAVKDELTPHENLMFMALSAGSNLSVTGADAALAWLGLDAEADWPCRFLSQGQKRRVALARLVADRRPLWLLDEPFAALDNEAVGRVHALLEAHRAHGGLVVMATHTAGQSRSGDVREICLGRRHVDSGAANA